MNYKVDTTMIPGYSSYRVCLSCWRKMPSVIRVPAQWAKKDISSKGLMTCSSSCGMRWLQSVNSRSYSTGKEDYSIEDNPYFQKYRQKLQELKSTDPQKYEAKVKELAEKERQMKEAMKKDLSTPPEPKTTDSDMSTSGSDIPGSVSWPPKRLDNVMKVDLIKDKTAEEIEQIWKEHYVTKDCVFGVVKALDYDSLMERARQFPLFIYPLPKGDGYEFLLSQFSGKDVYFTPLGVYQQLGENAPPCLTVAHFPELKEEKGIVLMAGQYDDKLLTKNESLNLVRQMSLYYGHSAGVNFNFVRMFNMQPDKFNYQDLINNYKSMKQILENYYT